MPRAQATATEEGGAAPGPPELNPELFEAALALDDLMVFGNGVNEHKFTNGAGAEGAEQLRTLQQLGFIRRWTSFGHRRVAMTENGRGWAKAMRERMKQ